MKASNYLIFAMLLVLSSGNARADRLKVNSVLATLEYLKNTEELRTTGVRVGVVYSKHNPASKQEGADLIQSLRQTTRQALGRRVVAEPINLVDGSELLPSIRSKALNMLYLSDGLGKFLQPVLRTARSSGLLVVGSGEEQLAAGAALGVDSRLGKLRIMVNAGELNRLGLQVDSRLLRLAKVVSTAGNGSDLAGPNDDDPVYQAPKDVRKRRKSGAEPHCPPAAKTSGTLMVRLDISPQGKIEELKFIKTHKEFERVVRRALKRWTFSPHIVAGRPVATYSLLQFKFSPR